MLEKELLLSLTLSDDAALAYHRLMIQYRLHDGDLPDDDKRIANLIKFSARRWKRVRPELEREFVVVGGRWRHECEDQDIAEAKRISEERSEYGKRGAKAKWGGGHG
jgi:uncharacterized protein YdaU (DUF1376 family)